MIDDKVLAELERLEKAATEGPWCVTPEDHEFANWNSDYDYTTSEVHRSDKLDDVHGCIIGQRGCYSDTYGGLLGDNRQADAALIALLRTHAAALIAEARSAKVLREEVRAWRHYNDQETMGTEEQDLVAAAIRVDSARCETNLAGALGGEA